MVAHGQMARGRARAGDARLRARRLRRAGVHDDHRVGPRHPQRQHDHHRPRRRAGPGAALPAARAGRPVVATGLRLPALPQARAVCRTSRGSGCRRSSTRRSWAPASRSRCRTSRSAARATSWAPSSTATWRPSASTCTPACWRRRSRRRRPSRDGRRAVQPQVSDGHRPAGRRLSCPTTTSRTSRRSWSSTGGWAGPATAGEVAAIRAELIDRFGPVPPPVERLLEVARLRISCLRRVASRRWRAKGHELIIRFGEDWSRAATMRAMAPTSLDRSRARRRAWRHHVRLESDAGPPAEGPGGGVEHHARRRGAADQARAGVCGVA